MHERSIVKSKSKKAFDKECSFVPKINNPLKKIKSEPKLNVF